MLKLHFKLLILGAILISQNTNATTKTQLKESYIYQSGDTIIVAAIGQIHNDLVGTTKYTWAI